ncbi:trigger factor [Pedomonas mirosovicensis]|uniref:trigger factor n=1 Tax=Pedomonas mirosovicensis TaxID=2908641 RepID=UPI00216A829D|nr:trigger factor [Pedomonas mirosovicensis]MCH8685608.1 trigger factor [Pedomonas mirosovicensis]
MQISETLNEGLKRAYTVVVPAADLSRKLDEQIGTVAKTIRMPGFRPGKVPTSLVRKVHGAALTGQVLEEAVQEGSQKVLEENKLRPALQPKIEVTKYEPESDLEFTMDLEILPNVAVPDLSGLKLEKWVIPVEDKEVDEAVERLASQQKAFEDAPKNHKAANGDAVIIDFVGKLNGEPFEGGKGEDTQLELGSGMFIPGFEEQLVGVKAGEEKTITVTFPAEYPAENLAGKETTFDVTVKKVQTAKPVEINDELAKNFGLESLESLKEILKSQIEREHNGLTRTYLKRKLLDALAATHDFPVPEGMVEAEFQQIWAQLEREAGDNEEEKAKLEAEKEEYRNIAVRRVRLGLLLSEIGQANNIQITQAEMNRLIAQEAQRYPGQQEQVVKFFQQNQMAAAQLRAPLYEEKVVDFILGQIEVTEKSVTREELTQALESDDETTSAKPADEAPKKKASKPKAKKTEAETEEAEAPAEAAPAKPKAKAKAKAEPEAEAGAEEAPAKPKKKAPAKASSKKAE